jgi:DNA-binding HxlR family transcriptional regulator
MANISEPVTHNAEHAPSPEEASAMLAELPACPVATTLTLIGNKWEVLILRDLLDGTRRFGELKRSVGDVSQKVLTSKLREMEASGLVTRTVYAEVPPRVEYSLTEEGRSLKPVIDAMYAWGEGYKARLRKAAGEKAPRDA